PAAMPVEVRGRSVRSGRRGGGAAPVHEFGRDEPHDVRGAFGFVFLYAAHELPHGHAPEPVGCALDRGERQGERPGELVGVASDDGQVGGGGQVPFVQDGGEGRGGGLVVEQQAGGARVGVEQGVQLAADLGLGGGAEDGVQGGAAGLGRLERRVLEAPDVGAAAFDDVFGLGDEDEFAVPERGE